MHKNLELREGVREASNNKFRCAENQLRDELEAVRYRLLCVGCSIYFSQGLQDEDECG